MQVSADPADPPVRSINAYLQQPLERIQKYKVVLKVRALSQNAFWCSERDIYIYIEHYHV